jgi:hypothetical protein
MDAIKKILVPTDFSAHADEAFPACLEEARLLFERCWVMRTISVCTPSRRAAVAKRWVTFPRRSRTWP